jgi:hypothetical protein
MTAAGPSAAGIRTIAKKTVVTGVGVGGVVAGSTPVALVVGAHVAVGAAGSSHTDETIVAGFIAGVVIALRPAGAGISRMTAAGPCTTGIRAVAKECVVADGGVVHSAVAGAVALIVRADVAVGGTGSGGRVKAVISSFIAGVGTLVASGTGIAGVAVTASGNAAVRSGTKEAVRTRRGVRVSRVAVV